MTRAPARRLAEVAKKVGVSEATVSRVLNGKAGVSHATREAVLTALDVLGYERPTQLRGERARLVGLVLPELQNPIFPALAEVIGGGLAQRGFTPVLCIRAAGGLSEADYVSMLLDQQVSGLVFAGGHFAEADAPHDHYRLLHSRGIPVVLLNAADGSHLDFPCVSTDDVAAGGQAFGHLASLGHQRIGLVVGPEDHMPSRRKLAAFTEHAERARRRASHRWSTRCSRWRAARPRPPGMLRHGVTGIICGSDVLALGAIRAVRRVGPDRARRRVGRRLRRFGLHELHRPAADHRPPAHRVDGQGRGGAARQPDGERDGLPGGTALRTRARRPRLHRPGATALVITGLVITGPSPRGAGVSAAAS